MRQLLLILFFCCFHAEATSGQTEDLTSKEIEEILLTDVYPIYTGDDGIECEAEIVHLEILPRTPEVVPVRLTAKREITRHGCAPEYLSCFASISPHPLYRWTTSFQCE